MKVTIRYMDDSISVLDIDEDSIKINSNEQYFMIDNDDDETIGWVVRENVKYVIIGELIDNFKDTKNTSSEEEKAVETRREY